MLGEVKHYANTAGKTAENRAVSDSAKFYAEDVSSQLSQDKEAWMALASGKPMSRYLEDLDAKLVTALTPLKLLDLQFARYRTNPSFRDLALYGTFVPYHHHHHHHHHGRSNNIERSSGGANKDNRPERVIVVRKCPSKMLVKTQFMSSRGRGSGDYGEMTWWERVEFEEAAGEMGMKTRHSFRPEEDKILEKLRENGLDCSIDVGFAYVVPYYPCTGVDSWSSKEPPPEQVEHFSHYLKYIIACHPKAKCLVSFDGWTGRFLATRCNFDQMQHIPFAPEYGVPQLGLNLYPISAKYKLIKASGLKHINMPHPCMWEEGGKNPSLKLKYQDGVRAMQEGVLKSGQKSINPFALMMSSTSTQSRAFVTQETDKEVDEGGGEDGRGEEEQEEGGEEISVDVEELLRRSGCTIDTDPFSIRPKLYSEEHWVVPDYLLKDERGGREITTPTVTCKCVRCDGKRCDVGCIVCTCVHGHRTPIGECPHHECDVAKNCIQWCVTPYFESAVSIMSVYTENIGTETPVPFPSLRCLCVYKIRRLSSDPENYMLPHFVAQCVTDDLMENFFSPCTLIESRTSAKGSIVSLLYEKCCNKYHH